MATKYGSVGAAKTNEIDTSGFPFKTGLVGFLLRWAPWLILLLTALVFIKSVFCDFTNFDDDTFILKNEQIRDISLDGLKAIFTSFKAGKYQPLTNFSFAIEYYFFGYNSMVVHLTNLLLHIASTLVVFKIGERLSGNRITAIVVSVLFAIHPMHVEEVVWASERKDTLYAFFYLLALLSYTAYISGGLKLKNYVVTFLLFVAALLSKSEAVTLPVLLIIIDVYKGRRIDRKAIIEKVPMLLLSVGILVVSFLSAQSEGGLGAVSIAVYGWVNRIFLFTSVPAFYIVKLLVPVNLSAMHYYPDMHNGLFPWMYYASLPFLLLVIWFVFRRSSFRKELLFGSAFFAGAICIMPQLVSVGPALTPERYSYIPYIGFFFIIGQWVTRYGVNKWRIPLYTGFGVLVLLFCVISWNRIDVWRNSEVLLTDVLEKNSDVADCSFFYWLRGNARMKEGSVKEAIEDYTIATQQFPQYAEAFSNRGSAYFQLGDFYAAIHDFDQAVKFKPTNARNFYNRAAGRASVGDFPGALADYDRFIQMEPNDANAYADRGMVRVSLKDTVGACTDWKKSAQMGNETAGQIANQVCGQ